MAPRRLARDGVLAHPAPPVRLVHLGLGNFFRAHAAAYTAEAPDAAEWGIVAFGGRSGGLADRLQAQSGLYTLVVRGPERDELEVVSSVAGAFGAADHEAWLRHLADPSVAAVTVTVTEAGYLLDAQGAPDVAVPALAADLDVLRRDPLAPVRTAPARLVAGFLARARADAGPLAVVSADNLPGNGPMLRRLLDEVAARVDEATRAWVATNVSAVGSMVDRITPRTTEADVAEVQARQGYVDRCPVITEPFREWVLAGEFPAGRPRWEDAGARFTDDLEPFEQRKLWLLNGAHSLLAYAGSILGHATVADAMGDDRCRGWVEAWWDEATRHLGLDPPVIEAYRAALVDRFGNRRIEHRLAQIAADGSQKLPVRVVPVLRAERTAGRSGAAASQVLAAWIVHLRGGGAPLVDPRAERLARAASGPLRRAVAVVLDALDASLGGDDALVGQVAEQSAWLDATRRGSPGAAPRP